MILLKNKTCEKPLQSNEFININGLHTTLVITVLKLYTAILMGNRSLDQEQLSKHQFLVMLVASFQ